MLRRTGCINHHEYDSSSSMILSIRFEMANLITVNACAGVHWEACIGKRALGSVRRRRSLQIANVYVRSEFVRIRSVRLFLFTNLKSAF